MTDTDFKSWIESNVETADIVNVWQLYQAVQHESEYHPFVCSKNNGRLFVKKSSSLFDETLMISSPEAKNAFLKMLNYFYADLGGVELAYAVDKHMEKD